MPRNTTPNHTSPLASNTDLVAVAGYVILVTGVLAAVPELPTAVAVPLALPALLFAPGYTVVTAIVPTTEDATGAAASGDRFAVRRADQGLSPLERLTLSVVASLAVVPLVALALNFVVGVALVATMVGVAAVTIVAAAVAARRREPSTVGPVTDPAAGSDSERSLLDGVPTDAVTLGCGAIALLMLVSSATLAATGGGTAGTEFYVVNETATGEYAATGYPDTLERGTATEVALGIEHHGGDARSYTVVAQLEQRGNPSDDGAATASELDRFSATIGPGEATIDTYAVTPTTAGEDRTLTFLLYEGDAPAEPSRETAHRVVLLPVDVE